MPQLEKICEVCGVSYSKAYGYSAKLWAARKFCSVACRGIACRVDPLESFRAKHTVDAVSGCWNWNANISPSGYGRMSFNGFRNYYAHRFSYEKFVGPIPEGLELDHLCRNRRCVNPAHLEAVTRRVNTLRGISPSARQAKQTHCIRGHQLSGDNLYRTKSGKRQCKACYLIRSRGLYAESEARRIKHREYAKRSAEKRRHVDAC